MSNDNAGEVIDTSQPEPLKRYRLDLRDLMVKPAAQTNPMPPPPANKYTGQGWQTHRIRPHQDTRVGDNLTGIRCCLRKELAEERRRHEAFRFEETLRTSHCRGQGARIHQAGRSLAGII